MTVIVKHLANDPEFVGIGFAKAGKLAEAFGSELPKILAQGDIEPLASIVGQEIAQKATSSSGLLNSVSIRISRAR